MRLGALDVFVPRLLKPAAQYWRAALARRAAADRRCRAAAGRGRDGAGTAEPRGAMLAYRRFGATWLRIDLADRLASHAQCARPAARTRSIRISRLSLGLDAEGLRKLMEEIGFVPAGAPGAGAAVAGRPAAAARAPATPSPRWHEARAEVRIDRYLYFIRLVKSRTLAQGDRSRRARPDRRQARSRRRARR